MCIRSFLLLCVSIGLYAQSNIDFSRAPNSYVFDPALPYDGFFIPIEKAYDVWETRFNTPIPLENQSVSIFWEDVSGLIDHVEIIGGANPKDSKLKVFIDKTKGEGNAVVAFHVGNNPNSLDDTVYWSWHIWVTDDPSNGVSYGGFANQQRTLANIPFVPQYMDRNLGATNASFLGYDWHKSPGLVYQWGRKDPMPPFIDYDGSFYEIYTAKYGALVEDYTRDISSLGKSILPHTPRPYATLDENLQYAIRNPLTYIDKSTSSNNWFSPNSNANHPNVFRGFDLWSDNYEGGNGGSNQPLSFQNQYGKNRLKSIFDPCPCGWRVPSFSSRDVENHVESPWGADTGSFFDDKNQNLHIIRPDSSYKYLKNIKMYPLLGYDFKDVMHQRPDSTWQAMNLGMFPLGGYHQPGLANQRSVFYDRGASSVIWGATAVNYGQARTFGLLADRWQVDLYQGFRGRYQYHAFSVGQTSASASVRCMQDPNHTDPAMPNFDTEYFTMNRPTYGVGSNYTVGIEQPNSYILNSDQSELRIPVSKGYAVYNQLLTKNGWPSGANQYTSVYWTTNKQIISKIYIDNTNPLPHEREIVIEINPSQKGNAIVALHIGDTPANDSILWTWHIWAPNTNPRSNAIAYTTEPITPSAHYINYTERSGFPPLKTVFMDRNLGALESFPSGLASQPTDTNLLNQAAQSGGLHYQWGRKDPLPPFRNPDGSNTPIYRGQINTNGQEALYVDTPIDNATYIANYTQPYSTYSVVAGINSNDATDVNTARVMKYATQNPLTYLYHQPPTNPYGDLYQAFVENDLSGVRDWVSMERAQATNRWGHGTRKSPFDPCPEGWRVPDMSFTGAVSGYDRGGSPWYSGWGESLNQLWAHSVSANYNGQFVNSTNNIGIGWVTGISANNPYRIGNYPNTGIRGRFGSNELTTSSAGVWTSALSDYMSGHAFGLEMSGNLFVTGQGFYPQAAMGCRCVLDKPRYTACDVIAAFELPFTNSVVGTVNITNTSQGAATYEWYVNGNSVSNSQNLNYIFVTKGKYTIQLTASNGTCTDTYSQTLTVVCSPTPNPIINGNNNVCIDGTYWYNVAAVSGATYLWTIAGGSIINGQGTYAVQVLWNNGITGTLSVQQTGP